MEAFGGAAVRRESPSAAALYLSTADHEGLASAEQLHGKEMSYNNYTDSDAAWRSAHDFDAPAVAIIKHANRVASQSAPTSAKRTVRPTPATRSAPTAG